MAKNILNTHLTAAQQGDQNAYRYLLNLYWNDVFVFLNSKTTNQSIDLEDLTVITFSKAFDKIETYNIEYSFKSWLFSIAKNLWIDELRKKKNTTIPIEQKNKELSKLFDDSPTPEDSIIIAQNLAALKANIKKLKPKYQQVIHLRFFDDLSYLEIAQQLDEPINNVKVKLLRAKKLLAEIVLNSKEQL